MKNNRQINKRNRKMQRKISIIIATDFLCWVPFVVICCLHSLSILDATPWYSLFSIVILPINSVINPLLYDSKASRSILRPVRTIVRISKHFSLQSISTKATCDEQISTFSPYILPSKSEENKGATSSTKMENRTGARNRIYVGNKIAFRNQPDSAKSYQQMSAGDPYFFQLSTHVHKNNKVSHHVKNDEDTTAPIAVDHPDSLHCTNTTV